MSKEIKTIRDCTTQRANANLHTQRGLGLLEDSLRRDGWIGAITVAADGETFDGSARLEVGASAGFEDAIIVESDGTKPVIVRRTDIATAADEKARRLGIAANRIAQIDLSWDTTVLAQLAADGMDLSDLFTGDEFSALANMNGVPDDPNELWQGMPEFEQEDKEAYQVIKVRFDSQKDVEDFAQRIGQSITPRTQSIWHPYKAPQKTSEYTVGNES